MELIDYVGILEKITLEDEYKDQEEERDQDQIISGENSLDHQDFLKE